MDISLSYDAPSKLQSELLVVILDKEKTFLEIETQDIRNIIHRLKQDFVERRIRREYFCTLNENSKIKNLLVYSTSLSPAYNIWENIKIFTARALRFCKDYNLKTAAICMNTEEAQPFIGKVVEGALLGTYSFDKYKKEKNNFYNEFKFQILGREKDDAQNRGKLNRYTIVSNAVNECRDLINEPGSVVYPEILANIAQDMAKNYGLTCTVLDEKKLERQGYQGLIQVGKGSNHPPRLIKLKYQAPKNSKYHLALVGKGVTFDSGGISLKPADKMYEMKGDMSGGAAVLYAMKAIAQLKPSVNVIGIVPTAENFPDANAQRPGDIFYAKNGKSIMVDNTDAEGRLILTDGLYAAGEENATHIVDIATLTGAVVRALGVGMAGIFGNDKNLIQAVIKSGENHGEAFWELPLVEEYKDLLKTPYADINNIGGPNAGAITAALFLREFIPEDSAWAHLDIAGPFIREKDWKYYEAGATAFGLKTLVDLCERFPEYFNKD